MVNLPDNWLNIMQANRVAPTVVHSAARYEVHAKGCHCSVCEHARDWDGDF